jgi:hypothetical protein
MKAEETECSETSAYKIQTPGYNPKERIHEFDLVSVWRCICFILCLYAPCSIFYPIPWGMFVFVFVFVFVFSDVYFMEL